MRSKIEGMTAMVTLKAHEDMDKKKSDLQDVQDQINSSSNCNAFKAIITLGIECAKKAA